MAGSETSWDAVSSFYEAVNFRRGFRQTRHPPQEIGSQEGGTPSLPFALMSQPERGQLGEAGRLLTWPEKTRAGCSRALLRAGRRECLHTPRFTEDCCPRVSRPVTLEEEHREVLVGIRTTYICQFATPTSPLEYP